MTIVPVWNSLIKYPLGAIVSYSGVYYVSIAVTAGSLPTDTTYWTAFSVLASGQPALSSITPVNAVAAAGTLTISGVVADGQTVTIGTDVYEFDTNSAVTAGRIAVDVSGGVTAPAAVTALVTAITASGTALVTAVDGAGDTVVLTATVKGTAAHSIVTTETMTNGAWGGAILAGGVNGTIGVANQLARDNSYLYVCIAANTVAGTNWRRTTLGSAY